MISFSGKKIKLIHMGVPLIFCIKEKRVDSRNVSMYRNTMKGIMPAQKTIRWWWRAMVNGVRGGLP
jgi:hypothetical protein